MFLAAAEAVIIMMILLSVYNIHLNYDEYRFGENMRR